MASIIRGSDNFDSLASSGLGDGQTWQNVTASRSVGVTYTNTTGKAIVISVYETLSTSYSYINLYIDENKVGVYDHSQTYTLGYGVIPVVNIIPNGSTYRLDNASSYTVSAWYELR